MIHHEDGRAYGNTQKNSVYSIQYIDYLYHFVI